MLADPRTYDGVVVGSRRIRWFDPHWPDPGRRSTTRVGFGPLTVRDHSEVVDEDLPGFLRLLVHVRPLGSAEVVFRLTAEGDRTAAEMTETPVSGVLALSWSPPAIALARWRNAVCWPVSRRWPRAGRDRWRGATSRRCTGPTGTPRSPGDDTRRRPRPDAG